MLGSNRLPGLEDIAALYLAAPLVLMLATWLPWWLGLPFAAIVIWVNMPFKSGARTAPSLLRVVVIGSIAVAAVLLSGTSPLVESVPVLDLAKHRWIYNDLVSRAWPVTYEHQGSDYVLRYGVGFYLVPAAISKLIGHTSMAMFLIWMALGVSIFLLLATEGQKSVWFAAVLALVALFFGGLDVLGIPLNHTPRTGLGFLEFREDWAFNPFGWIIPSNSFALSWSPQHALAGWLGGALIYRQWQQPQFLGRSVGIFASLAIWSPFAALSFALVVAVLAIWQFAQGLRVTATLTPRNCASLAVVSVLLAYYSLGQSVGRVTFLPAEPFPFLPHYLLFVALEFGVYVALIASTRIANWRPIAIASVLLLAFPILYFGMAANDIVMSGSRLLMTIVMMGVFDALSTRRQYFQRATLVVAVCLGLYTGLGEAARLISAPRIVEDWTKPITELAEPYVWQYIAPTPSFVSSR